MSELGTRTGHEDGSYEVAVWQDAHGNPTGRQVAERGEGEGEAR